MKRDWDTTYRVKGVVQKNVLSSVRTAVERLKSAGCERLLDLCCGSGRHTLYLAKAGFDVYSMDVSLYQAALIMSYFMGAALPRG